MIYLYVNDERVGFLINFRTLYLFVFSFYLFIYLFMSYCLQFNLKLYNYCFTENYLTTMGSTINAISNVNSILKYRLKNTIHITSRIKYCKCNH